MSSKVRIIWRSRPGAGFNKRAVIRTSRSPKAVPMERTMVVRPEAEARSPNSRAVSAPKSKSSERRCSGGNRPAAEELLWRTAPSATIIVATGRLSNAAEMSSGDAAMLSALSATARTPGRPSGRAWELRLQTAAALPPAEGKCRCSRRASPRLIVLVSARR